MADTKRVNRTKKKIADALIQLMKENRYDDITIMEICYSADIARKTYYNNFKSKEDVLGYKLQLLLYDFLEDLKSRGEISIKTMAYTYFNFAYDHYDFIHLLVKNKIFHILLKAFDRYMPYMGNLAVELKSTKKEVMEYRSVFYSGGLWHMLQKWVTDGCKQSPDELSEMFLHISGTEVLLSESRD